MRRESDKHGVISLSNECFKHYLIERYGKVTENAAWTDLEDLPEDLIPAETWIDLVNKAKQDIEGNGGRLLAYEVVNDELISHERIVSYWPVNWMWVLQFSNN
jgi:hypothetical protein